MASTFAGKALLHPFGRFGFYRTDFDYQDARFQQRRDVGEQFFHALNLHGDDNDIASGSLFQIACRNTIFFGNRRDVFMRIAQQDVKMRRQMRRNINSPERADMDEAESLKVITEGPALGNGIIGHIMVNGYNLLRP